MENSIQSGSASLRSNIFNLISIFPMITTLSLLFSTRSLLALLRTKDAENIPLGFGQWHFLYSVALATPVAAFISKMIPHAWQLMLGAILTIGGTLFVPLVSEGMMQILLLAITSGFGVTTMFHGSYPSVSHYFKRLSIVMCSLILLMFWIIIVNAFQLMEEVNTVNQAMLLIGAGTALTCVMPAGLMIKLNSSSHTSSHRPRCHSSATEIHRQKSSRLPTDQMSIAIMFPSVLQDVNHLVRTIADFSIVEKTGFVSLALWWALGVNFTSMNERRQFAMVRIAALQCLLPLITAAIKVIVLFCHRHLKSHNVDSKTTYDPFLTIGLIGTAGMTLVVYPAFTNPFHNHLLFSLVYIIQIIDLTDALGSFKGPHHAKLGNDSTEQHVTTKSNKTCSFLYFPAMGLLINACLLYLTHPFAGAVLAFINSFDLAIATDVICLGVFSLLAIILSVVRLSDA